MLGQILQRMILWPASEGEETPECLVYMWQVGVPRPRAARRLAARGEGWLGSPCTGRTGRTQRLWDPKPPLGGRGGRGAREKLLQSNAFFHCYCLRRTSAGEEGRGVRCPQGLRVLPAPAVQRATCAPRLCRHPRETWQGPEARSTQEVHDKQELCAAWLSVDEK